jgi:S-formylglutathione hydrolase FrmB
MAFLNVEHYSMVLHKSNGIYVLLPEQKGPFPVLYLLHGLSDNHTAWMRRTSIERYAENLPLIIVMANGERGWYCNDPSPSGLPWEDYISGSLVKFVDQAFPTIPHASGRVIAGLSMGGYGAILHHLRHPDVFSAASSHSGGVAFNCRRFQINGDIDRLSQPFPAGQYDLFALARKAKKSQVKLRMDCGTEDFLLEHNRAYHQHLTKLGIEHAYAEFPGVHEWDYWDRHIGDTLDFAMRHFAQAKRRKK